MPLRQKCQVCPEIELTAKMPELIKKVTILNELREEAG
jgi:hypothetical protein